MSQAPTQLLPDSLEVTPRLRAVPDTPEPGLMALSLDLQLRNRRQKASLAVPRIGFRVWRTGADTASSPAWQRPARYARRRTGADSLTPGGALGYGLSMSPSLVVRSRNDEGLYRVEAFLVDATGAERTVQIGHVRLRLSH